MVVTAYYVTYCDWSNAEVVTYLYFSLLEQENKFNDLKNDMLESNSEVYCDTSHCFQVLGQAVIKGHSAYSNNSLN